MKLSIFSSNPKFVILKHYNKTFLAMSKYPNTSKHVEEVLSVTVLELQVPRGFTV